MFFKIKKFFFENTGLKQTIVKNTFWLMLAETISRFFKVFLVIYAARILGANEYGKFIFALAFVSLFVILSDFGISPIVTREFSKDREREKDFSSVFSLEMLFSIGALLLILLGSFFITQDQTIRLIIWILAFFIIVDSFPEIFYAFLRARQKMEYESWAKILQVLLVTMVGFYVLTNFPSAKNLSYAYLFSSLLGLILIAVFFSAKVCRLRWRFDKLIWQKLLLMSWPLALAGVFSTIYSQIDLVMLGHLKQITQAGWYGASYRIIGMILVPAALISQSFFPAMSISFKESKEKLQKIFNKFIEAMIFLSLPLAVGGIALAPKIIDWIYDPSFLPAALAFQILLLMAAMTFIINPLSLFLMVAGEQKKIFWITLAGAIINIILNLILIPRFSLYGAAWATVATYAILLAFFLYYLLKLKLIRVINSEILSNFLGVILASTCLFFSLSYLKPLNYHVFFLVLIGAAVYLISFLVYKGLLERNLMRPKKYGK